MNLGAPAFLLLALVPLGLWLWLRRRAARPADAAETPAQLRRLAVTHDRIDPRGLAALPARVPWRFGLALGLVLVALAGPQWGRVEESVIDQSREILIALDLSRSMLAEDVRPTRLERARLLIASLLGQLRGERVGLVVFSGTAFVQLPLSSDYEILRDFLPALGPGYLPAEGTDFDAMLATALPTFGPTATDRFLIVMSDGEAEPNAWRDRLPALVADGVRVISLGFGTAVGAGVPDADGRPMVDTAGTVVTSRLERTALEELARATGGLYRDANRWVDVAALLDRTFERDAAGIVRAGGTRLGERYQWLLAPAILLLAWSCWREFALQPRPRAYHASGGTGSARAAVVAATLIGLLALGLPPGATRAQEITATARAMESLTEVVRRVSARPALGAPDYAELAFAVVANASRIRISQEPVPPAIIRDGLAAVAAGRALDARAFDWDRIQSDLVQLSRLPRAPDVDRDASEPPTEAPSATDDAPPEGATPGEGEQADAGAEGADDQGPAPVEGDPLPQDAFADAAAGGIDPEPEGEGTNDPNSQQVGGMRQRDYAALRDPSLLVPLHKLDDLRRADSPGELYQLMQDSPAEDAPTKTQRW